MKFNFTINNLKKFLVSRQYVVCVQADYDRVRLVAAETIKPCAVLLAVTQELPQALQGSSFWHSDMVQLRAEFLQQLLTENDIDDIKNIIIVLGSGDAIKQQLSMPDMSARELAEAVHWDMLQYVPWADGDYYSAAAPMQKDSKADNTGDVNFYAADFNYGQKQVVAAAAQASCVDNAGAICTGAGLKLRAVTTALPGAAVNLGVSGDVFASGPVWGGMFLGSGELEQIEAEYGDIISVVADYAIGKLTLNLLPKRSVNGTLANLLTTPRLHKYALLSAAGCAAVLIACGLFLQQQAAGELEKARGKQQALQDVRIQYEKLQSVQQRLDAASRAKAAITLNRREWYKILAALSYAASADVQVEQLRQQETERQLAVTGRATGLDDVTTFSNKLRQTGQFVSVKLAESGADGGKAITFTLLLDIAAGREGGHE